MKRHPSGQVLLALCLPVLSACPASDSCELFWMASEEGPFTSFRYSARSFESYLAAVRSRRDLRRFCMDIGYGVPERIEAIERTITEWSAYARGGDEPTGSAVSGEICRLQQLVPPLCDPTPPGDPVERRALYRAVVEARSELYGLAPLLAGQSAELVDLCEEGSRTDRRVGKRIALKRDRLVQRIRALQEAVEALRSQGVERRACTDLEAIRSRADVTLASQRPRATVRAAPLDWSARLPAPPSGLSTSGVAY